MQNNENSGEITSLVVSQDGKAITTSLKVAEAFGKVHKNVLRDIQKLIIETQKFQNIGGLKFELSYYKSMQGKDSPMYLMNKNAFTLLVMGYSGEKALQFKLIYIDAFDAMENHIANLQNQLQKNIPQTTNEIAFFEELKTMKFQMENLKLELTKADEKLHERIFYLENISDNRPYIPVNTPPKPLSDFYVYFAYNPENGLTKINRNQDTGKKFKNLQDIEANMQISMFINVNSLKALVELESFLHKIFCKEHHSEKLFLLTKTHFAGLELLKIAVEALS